MDPLGGYKVDDLMARIAAKTPVPGGGSVACVVASMAASLAGMVVAYSIDKPEFGPYRVTLAEAQARLLRSREMMIKLGDEDAEAYAALNALRKLPATDPRRAKEYPAAADAAISVPMAVLAACADLLILMSDLTNKTNKQLRSDLAIAAVLADAAGCSCEWNVVVNLPLLGDATHQERSAALARGMVERCATLRKQIERACGGGHEKPKE